MKKILTERHKLPRTVAELYVLGLKEPFAYIDPWTDSLEQYDGKIVECSYVVGPFLYGVERGFR